MAEGPRCNCPPPDHAEPPYGNLTYEYLVEHFGTVDWVPAINVKAGHISWNNVSLPFALEKDKLATTPGHFKYVHDQSVRGI